MHLNFILILIVFLLQCVWQGLGSYVEMGAGALGGQMKMSDSWSWGYESLWGTIMTGPLQGPEVRCAIVELLTLEPFLWPLRVGI